MFKSDRCGIETIMALGISDYVGQFKSDRCGIETGTVICRKRNLDYLFKSDRCGIETAKGEHARMRTAARSNQTVAGLKQGSI